MIQNKIVVRYMDGQLLKGVTNDFSPNKDIFHLIPADAPHGSKPMELSPHDVNDMVVRHGFYERNKNPDGKGFSHRYNLREINGAKVVFDEISYLMWQQSGSDERMEFKHANKYINELNEKDFAGFNDWRLPTLEETMSLVEPDRKSGLYINPVFDHKQNWLWSADQNLLQGSVLQWVVNFIKGYCYFYLPDYGTNYVRAVRFGQSDKSD